MKFSYGIHVILYVIIISITKQNISSLSISISIMISHSINNELKKTKKHFSNPNHFPFLNLIAMLHWQQIHVRAKKTKIKNSTINWVNTKSKKTELRLHYVLNTLKSSKTKTKAITLPSNDSIHSIRCNKTIKNKQRSFIAKQAQTIKESSIT